MIVRHKSLSSHLSMRCEADGLQKRFATTQLGLVFTVLGVDWRRAQGEHTKRFRCITFISNLSYFSARSWFPGLPSILLMSPEEKHRATNTLVTDRPGWNWKENKKFWSKPMWLLPSRRCEDTTSASLVHHRMLNRIANKNPTGKENEKKKI